MSRGESAFIAPTSLSMRASSAQAGPLCVGPCAPHGVYHFSMVAIWYFASRATSLALNSRVFTAPWKLVGMRSHDQYGAGSCGMTTGANGPTGRPVTPSTPRTQSANIYDTSTPPLSPTSCCSVCEKY